MLTSCMKALLLNISISSHTFYLKNLETIFFTSLSTLSSVLNADLAQAAVQDPNLRPTLNKVKNVQLFSDFLAL